MNWAVIFKFIRGRFIKDNVGDSLPIIVSGHISDSVENQIEEIK